MKLLVILFTTLYFCPLGFATGQTCVWSGKAYSTEGQSLIVGKPESLTLIRSMDIEAVATTLPAHYPAPQNGVQYYRLTYHSLDMYQQNILLSALIAVPDTCQEDYPSILLHHGTIFLDSEAPTVSALGRDSGLLEASQGFVALVPDYLGLGESQAVLHPYLIERAYVQSSLDLLSAMRIVTDDQQKDIFRSFFLKGYSEGGYATVAVQKALQAMGPEGISITASAPGAGPYNLIASFQGLIQEQSVKPEFLGMILNSYFTYLPQDKDLDSILTGIDKAGLSLLYDGSLSRDQIKERLPSRIEDWFHPEIRQAYMKNTQDLLNNVAVNLTSFEAQLQANSVDKNWKPSVPTRFFHCIDDSTVSVSQSDRVFAQLGVENPLVSYDRIPTPADIEPYNHRTCPGYFTPLAWFRSFLPSSTSR